MRTLLADLAPQAFWALVFAFLAPLAMAQSAPDERRVSPRPGWDDLPPAVAQPSDWPWWRGPNLDNHAIAATNPPLQWSETNHVRWRVSLPGKGHSTPCIWGDRIFLPQGDPRQSSVWLVCLDRASGRQLWQTAVYRGPAPRVHENNSQASATPACDGERIFFPYQTPESVWMAAVDLNGKVLWNKEVGSYWSVQGYSASPALHRSLVITPVDGAKGNELFALHRRTGEVVWRAPLRKVSEGYASPLCGRVAGRDQLLLIGGIETRSYDPNTGRLLWLCTGPAEWCAASPAFSDRLVFATGGHPEKALLAIRADGSGDVTASHIVWKGDSKVAYVPSPLYAEGLLYVVTDTGFMRCYDAETGRVFWGQNLGGQFYSSPVLAADRLYVFDRKGKGHVLKAGRQFESLAVNVLPNGTFATPVILGGRIYLRTLGDFYCLAQP